MMNLPRSSLPVSADRQFGSLESEHKVFRTMSRSPTRVMCPRELQFLHNPSAVMVAFCVARHIEQVHDVS
jgi:hypothetical protein